MGDKIVWKAFVISVVLMLVSSVAPCIAVNNSRAPDEEAMPTIEPFYPAPFSHSPAYGSEVHPSGSNSIAKDLNLTTRTTSVAPEEEWNRTFGGTYGELAYSVQQTSGGGYIIAGITWSYGAGYGDFWLVKTDSSGKEEWNRTFGGTYEDRAHSVQQTSDGGYIIAGTTDSYGAGHNDFWLVKTDSSGKEEWNRTFGGTYWDRAYSVQQTSDGGYIIAGTTDSYGAGHYDFWLVKTDSSGKEEWNRTFGGIDWDEAYSVQQTSDGGYIIAGYTDSYGVGSSYFWLVKTDSSGKEEWDRTFGGTYKDRAYSVQQTSDGGYIIAGYTHSYGAGSGDFWLVKTDSSGKEEWDRTFGGTYWDRAHSVQQTSDGGYIIAGETESYGAGSIDFWLVKTDSSGKEEWNRTFGGTDGDWTESVQQTSDGGYIIAGTTDSYGAGYGDFWLIKLRGEVIENRPPIASFAYSPENPVVNQAVTFDASNSTDSDGTITSYEWDFGDGTNGTGEIITYSYSSAGDFVVNLTVTDDDGVTNSTSKLITVSELERFIFDTGAPASPYPSIMGNHTGTIKSNHTVIATKLYTYSCIGTGGHTEYAKIWNATWNATAAWDGYAGDWHNITFDKTVVLLPNETYNYTIITGSYPQIHHTPALPTDNGWINCTKFTDANRMEYTNWVPAIRLWSW
jgi:uncharacterized delta-60 repeat protein